MNVNYNKLDVILLNVNFALEEAEPVIKFFNKILSLKINVIIP